MKNFKKLKIWQHVMNLVAMTYKLAGELPKEEKFGLKSQTSNIAEGSAKSSNKEYGQFLEYSLGSAYELETQVLIIDMLNYGTSQLRKELLAGIDEEQKMIQSFIQTVSKR